ncbi:hypothetical protein [Nannocystis pusilla]|uniref:hypothetical protein n=1 Tax=Nannocystis pusilla TaxID=889268 RepID=UPI003B7BD265
MLAIWNPSRRPIHGSASGSVARRISAANTRTLAASTSLPPSHSVTALSSSRLATWALRSARSVSSPRAPSSSAS